MKKERIEKKIHLIVSHYLQQNASCSGKQGIMVTVTQVEITPRLDIAKVHVSFVGGNSQVNHDHLLQRYVVPYSWPIRKEIAYQLRNTSYAVPREIRFYVDTTPSKAAAIEEILATVREEI